MFGVIESRKWTTSETQERVWEGVKLKEKPTIHEIHSFPTTLGNEFSSTSRETMDFMDCLNSKGTSFNKKSSPPQSTDKANNNNLTSFYFLLLIVERINFRMM